MKKARKIFCIVCVIVVLVESKKVIAGCLDVERYKTHTYSAKLTVLKEYRIRSDIGRTLRSDGKWENIYYYVYYQDRLVECVCGKQLKLTQVRDRQEGPFYD